jgi:beta-phosphoglucomutase
MRIIWIFIMLINLTDCFADVKAVLFDCDGTLVDSEYAHFTSWRKALNDLGSDLTLEDYYQYVGKSAETNARLLAEKVGTDCAELLLKNKREYYRDFCIVGLPPIVATIDFLKLLASKKRQLGIKIGVCSAARKEEIIFHLKHLKIDDLFDIVLSGQEDLCEYSDPEGVNKPKPYIYLHAMKMLDVLPEETIVIEDSASGARAGVSAGCFTIAIPNDFTKDHDFSHTQWQVKSFAGMSIDDFFNKITKLRELPQNPQVLCVR